jgi:ABC-type polysaccharide/polyol phosphate export permease
MLYFLTPVFYRAELIGNTNIPVIGSLLRYNPFGAFVEIVRKPLVDGQLPPAEVFGYAALITGVSLVTALVTLHSKERTLIFHM